MKQYLNGLILFYCLIFSFACVKDYTKIDPVAPYPKPVGDLVKFADRPPSKSPVVGGDVVNVYISGLDKIKDSFDFFINEVECEVINYDANSVTIKVPKHTYSGVSSININKEVYYGPRITVESGLVVSKYSSLFFNDAKNLGVREILAGTTANPSFFTWANSKQYFSNSLPTIGESLRIKVVLPRYIDSDPSANLIDFDARETVINGEEINDVLPLSIRNKYIVSGKFRQVVNNIDGSKDVLGVNNVYMLELWNSVLFRASTTIESVFNETKTPGGDKVIVPLINGGTNGRIVKTFATDKNENLISIGSFKQYIKTDYLNSSDVFLKTQIIKVNNIVKYGISGKFDTAFNFKPGTNESKEGPNGAINGGVIFSDKKLILVGKFTKYNGVPANNIVEVDLKTGDVTNTFKIKSGADGEVTNISYNAKTKKFILFGKFKNYDNQPRAGVVLLNSDGAIDPNFVIKEIDQGEINFATQLSRGEIIIGGSFNKYDGIPRSGIAFLMADGKLSKHFNPIGPVKGKITSIAESYVSPLSQSDIIVKRSAFTLLVFGDLEFFDDRPVENAAMLHGDYNRVD